MKEIRFYLIAGILLLALYLVVQYYKPKPTDWTATYSREDKIPFGTYILDEQIHTLFPHSVLERTFLPVFNTLNGKPVTGANYIFIAGAIKMDKLDFRELQKFIQRGNHALIAAYELNNILKDSLKLDVGLSGNSAMDIHFIKPTQETQENYQFDRGIASQFFSRFDTLRASIVGKNENGDANFLKYSMGKGALYIMPNPQLFTNYSLLQSTGADYAARALSYLPVAKKLMIDEHSTHESTENQSLLREIFKHPQLQWAYEIAIFSLLIFVCFEMKRRQRIIPVIAPIRNSSVDFVKVVGQVYYQERDHRDIAQKKIIYLLEFLRQKYHLKTSELNRELEELLTIKSGVSENTVQQLFAAISNIRQTKKVSDQQLIDLNQYIEKFYQQSH